MAFWDDLCNAMPAVAAPASAWETLGSAVSHRGARAALQAQCGQRYGAVRAFALSGGRWALWLLCRAAAECSGRRKIVVPAYTCPTVGMAVVEAGLEPVPCDVAAADFNLDPAALAEVVDDETAAVICAHMFGTACHMPPLMEACRRRGALLIEDCAQAAGARYEGQEVGTFGEAAVLSFGRGKNVRAYRGGMGIARHEPLAAAAERLYAELPEPGWRRAGTGLVAQLAMTPLSRPKAWYFVRRLPFLQIGLEARTMGEPPARLAAWQCRLAVQALRRVEAMNAARRDKGRYVEALMRDDTWLTFQRKPPEDQSAYVRLAARIVRQPLAPSRPASAASAEEARSRRDALWAALQRKGIDVQAFYSRALYQYNWWPGGLPAYHCPVAEAITQDNLILPLHYAATEAQLGQMVKTLRAAWQAL